MRLSIKCSRLISFFPFSFWLFVLYVFLPQFFLFTSLFLLLTTLPERLFKLFPLHIHIRIERSVCCCNSLLDYMMLPQLLVCLCLWWWLQCEKHRVMKTHFYHLLHCLFHYIEHRYKNKDGNMGLWSGSSAKMQKENIMQRVKIYKERASWALPKQVLLSSNKYGNKNEK